MSTREAQKVDHPEMKGGLQQYQLQPLGGTVHRAYGCTQEMSGPSCGLLIRENLRESQSQRELEFQRELKCPSQSELPAAYYPCVQVRLQGYNGTTAAFRWNLHRIYFQLDITYSDKAQIQSCQPEGLFGSFETQYKWSYFTFLCNCRLLLTKKN